MARAIRAISNSRSFTLRLRSRSLVPTAPTISVIFFMVRVSTRTPSPSKRTVGRMVDVALHHGGVDAHAPARNDAVVLRYFHHPIVDLPEHLRPDRQAPAPHGLGIRHLPAAHSGEVAVHEVGAHLAFQAP